MPQVENTSRQPGSRVEQSPGQRTPCLLMVLAFALQAAVAAGGEPTGDPCGRLDAVWAGNMGPGAFIKDSAIDGNDAIIVSGDFGGSPDFDPGEGVDQPSLSPTIDLFTTKIRADGSYAWTYVAQAEGTQVAQGVAVPDDNSVVVAGEFAGTVDFDPTNTVDARAAVGDRNAFVINLGPDGTYRWVRTFGQGSAGVSARRVEVDSVGSLVIVGSFSGIADFDPGQGEDIHTSTPIYDVLSNDAFVTKLGSDGSYQWTRTLGGPGYDRGTGVAVDGNDDVFVTGTFRGTADFDPGPGEDWHTATGMVRDIYITKLRADGSYAWTRTLPAGYEWEQGAITVDHAGNAYVTGCFRWTVDLDPTAGADFRTAVADSSDTFLTMIRGDGSYGWTYTAGGQGDECGFEVATRAGGGVVVVGMFRGATDFDPGKGEDIIVAAGDDVFVIVLHENGGYEGTSVMTGPYNEWGRQVVVDSTDSALVTGLFATIEPVDFDPSCEAIELPMHDPDIGETFLAKLVCLEPSADANRDGDVDMHDWATFQTCLTGENRTECNDGCSLLDFDGDSDIDMFDYFEFIASFHGPIRGQ